MSKDAIPRIGQQHECNESVEEEKILRGPFQAEYSVVTIDENAVTKIAGMVTRGVPGVYDTGSAVRRVFSAVTDRTPSAQINVIGGVNVQKGRTQTVIEITVATEYGVSIVEVFNAIRRNAIEQLKGTIGLETAEININATDVHLPDEDAGDSGLADLR